MGVLAGGRGRHICCAPGAGRLQRLRAPGNCPAWQRPRRTHLPQQLHVFARQRLDQELLRAVLHALSHSAVLLQG